MKRELKSSYVTDFKQIFSSASMVVLSKQGSMKVSDSEELRKRCRDQNVQVKVCKNSLMKLAIKDTDYSYLSDDFKGRIVLAWSSDEVSAAKIMIDYQKSSKQKLEVISGGQTSEKLDYNQIEHLASLPSLNELRSGIIGAITSPATKIVRLLKEPSSQISRLLKAKGEK